MVNILEVKDVSFQYSGRTVIEDINLQVRPGEIIGILGPNGCGKTTLLKILNRNLKALTGTVLIEGDEVNEISKRAIAQRMAVVPQNNEVSFSFTVLDIVLMGRMPSLERFQEESEDDLRIVYDAMEKCNILQFAERYINHLSGGERQRAIIARALAQEPKILLMDEPTLHLDVNHQIDMLDMVTGLAREEGLTVVIVTHDLSLAARYCDRLFLISDHRIAAFGPVREVLTPENMRHVFSIDAYVEENERVGGPVVQIIGSVKE